MSIPDPQSEIHDPDALLLVGRVVRAHGVRGEVKVLPETDDPDRLMELDAVYIGKEPEQTARYEVTGARAQPTKRGLLIVLQMAGVESREGAEALRGLPVFAREEDLPPLGEDEFFLHDLVGLHVETDAGEPVGTVRDVLEMPAHPVCVVAREGKADALIPAVPEFIAEVDLEAERLVIRPLEGLLE